MQTMHHYLIKELATKTQLSTDTIRFYEKKNLIQPSFRADNQYRYYNHDTLKRLILIKRCRAMDMTLKEIEALLELEKNPQQDCCGVNNLIDLHLTHIEAKIAELQQFQNQLQQLRQACATQTTIQNCEILKQLENENSD